jgi:hypothetical protein
MSSAEQQSWRLEKAWADDHINAINDVVRSMAHKIITITPSSFHRDTEEAIDYDIQISSGAMVCRIRRAATCPYRDLTMTTHRPSGARPEVEKVLDGKVRWYLYAWAEAGGFVDWMFVDLAVVRANNLIENAMEKGREVRVKDGSRFTYIHFPELDHAGAIVAAEIMPRAARRAG